MAIDDSAYVLTLDYTIKMLNIHERYECGVPVIIEGETGVGKTALIEMLSKLWNQSLLLEWKKQRDRVVEFFVRTIGEISVGASENYQVRYTVATRLCNINVTWCNNQIYNLVGTSLEQPCILNCNKLVTWLLYMYMYNLVILQSWLQLACFYNLLSCHECMYNDL